jgi:DNA-binding CsgD family transcriptional regulator
MTPSIARRVIASFRKQTAAQDTQGQVLSEREDAVLQRMALGKSYAAIADELFLSVDGVYYHIRHIYEKLQVHSRSQAIAEGLRRKIIRPPN